MLKGLLGQVITRELRVEIPGPVPDKGSNKDPGSRRAAKKLLEVDRMADIVSARVRHGEVLVLQIDIND